MTHKLILSYMPENEHDGELRASIEGAGYSGQGAAWFNVAQLQSFCAVLAEYPISSDTPISLSGGYWNDDATALVQTHIGLTIAPFDIRGSLLVSVQLSAPIWDLESSDKHRCVMTHFRTDYLSLDRFRASLLIALEIEGKAATLHGQ